MPIVIDANSSGFRHADVLLGDTPSFDASSSYAHVEDQDITPMSTTFVLSAGRNILPATEVVLRNGVIQVSGVDYNVTDALTGEITFLLDDVDPAEDTVLVSYDTDVVTYAWSIIDLPTGSAVVISGPSTSSTVSLTAIDVQGTYLVQLRIDAGLDSEEFGTAAVCLPTLKKSIRIPAAGEETEFDDDKGWQDKLSDALDKVAIGGSYHLITVGDEPGADYTVTKLVDGDLVNDINADLFGKGVPSYDNLYIIKLLSPVSGDVSISGGIILDGNGQVVEGDVGSPGNACITVDNTVNPAISGVFNTKVLGTGKTQRVVFLQTASASSSKSEVYVKDCTILTPTGALGIEFGDTETTPITENVFVHIDNVRGMYETTGTTVVGVSVGGETSSSLFISNSILDNVEVRTNNDTDIINISNSVFLSDLTFTAQGSTTQDVVADLYNTTVVGDLVIDSTVTGGGIDLYNVSVSNINNQTGIDDFVTDHDAPVLLRDYITPGVVVSGTDILLTNTSFLHTGGISSDFSNLLIYVDGMLMSMSNDPSNFSSRDARPGSDGSNFQLNFDTTVTSVIQVIRNA